MNDDVLRQLAEVLFGDPYAEQDAEDYAREIGMSPEALLRQVQTTLEDGV